MVDASVVVELLLQTADAHRVASAVLHGRDSLHAPHLLDVEVSQVIRRYALRGDISEEHGRDALDLLVRMPIRRYPHGPLIQRIWELRHNVTAYDAAYVALADALGAQLVTRDSRLAERWPGSAEIRLI